MSSLKNRLLAALSPPPYLGAGAQNIKVLSAFLLPPLHLIPPLLHEETSLRGFWEFVLFVRGEAELLHEST
jgi:hypothetical protein